MAFRYRDAAMPLVQKASDKTLMSLRRSAKLLNQFGKARVVRAGRRHKILLGR